MFNLYDCEEEKERTYSFKDSLVVQPSWHTAQSGDEKAKLLRNFLL